MSKENKAAARDSNSLSAELEGESAPRLGSPLSIDEAETPQPGTTTTAPRDLEDLGVAATHSHPPGRFTRKRTRATSDTSARPSKRMRSTELVEVLASFQRTRWGSEAVQGGCFTTPPNLPRDPRDVTPSAPVLVFPPDNQGSPIPQQQTRTMFSSTQLNTTLVGEAIPDDVVAVRVRGDHAGRAPEPTSSRANPNHMVASRTLAIVAEGSNPLLPPTSGPSSLSVRTSAATSVCPPPINATPTPTPAPPAISAVGPATGGHDSSGSQGSDSTSSGGTADANQAPALGPVGAVPAPPTLLRPGHGMPPISVVHPSVAIDPFQFTGAIQRLSGRANPETPPDNSARQVAPETPMATPTRYGTEIHPSMQHLYR